MPYQLARIEEQLMAVISFYKPYSHYVLLTLNDRDYLLFFLAALKCLNIFSLCFSFLIYLFSCS